jgi:hypothetical protein
MSTTSLLWVIAGLLLLALFGLFRRPSDKVKPVSATPDRAAFHQVTTALKEPAALDAPEGFGYKMAWLAVRTTNTAALLKELPLRQLQQCTWQKGVAGAYGQSVFVTPPIGEWTLVAGTSLFFLDSPAAAKEAEALLLQLSQTFGEAQYFSSHRVVEAHGWMKAVAGKVIRAYAHVGDKGETVIATGVKSCVEPATLVNTLSAAAQQDPSYLERPDLTSPTEELVMEVAAHWSVDPTSLEERRDIAPGRGWQGHYNRK